MSKNLQQVQVGSGVITPDKLFTDNILETRLKAAEEAKMLDKRLAAAEKEGELSRDLTKTQYEAQNQLARDKLAADVEDQTSRLALLKDQDARQAALHGMQLGEAGMKLDKLAKADAAERAYVSAISNPEEIRNKALLEASPESRKLLQEQQAVASNLAALSEEDRAQATKALPSVLDPNNTQARQLALDTFRSNVNKETLKDNVRSQLASRLGVAPTEEQVSAIVGDIGVDYTAQQKAMDERYDKELKQLSDIVVAGVRSGNLSGALSNKPSGVASGLGMEGVSTGTVFSSKDNYAEAKNGAVMSLTELKGADGNPFINPKDVDALVELAALKGITGYDSEGKAHFDMSPEELAATAVELKNSGALQRMQSSGKGLDVEGALALMGRATSKAPNARATYGSRIANALYGDSGANLPKATSAPAAAANIGSTYDKYVNDSTRLAEEKVVTQKMTDTADRLTFGDDLNSLVNEAQRAIAAGVDKEWVKNKVQQGDVGSISAAADAGTSSRILSSMYAAGNTLNAVGNEIAGGGSVLKDVLFNGANFSQAIAKNRELFARAEDAARRANSQKTYADYKEQAKTIPVDPYLQDQLNRRVGIQEALENTILTNRRLPQ